MRPRRRHGKSANARPSCSRISSAALRRGSRISANVDGVQANGQTLPQRYFISPEVFAEEREAIFARQWIFVAHQSEIPRSGDYLLRDVAGECLIITRDQQANVR